MRIKQESWLTPENRAAIELRFWSKVEIRGADECWPWRATRRPDGYGMFYVGGMGRPASRVAFSLAAGRTVYPRRIVCHACDNPPCCNPAHLWEGTFSQNMFDAVAKGRFPKKGIPPCP